MNSNFNESVQIVRGVLRSIWKRRWIGLYTAAVVGGLGVVAVSFLSDRFEAGAKVYVDTQTVLKPLMAGLTVQPDIDQQVRMLAKTLVSRPNVERLMDSPELNLAPKNPSDREATLTMLTGKIKVEPAGSGNLYAITYRDTDPTRARRLVENLVELFMSSSTSGKRRDSEDAGRFIDEQIKNHESKLVEAENRVKEFKLRNFGLTGVNNQDYFSRMSTLLESAKKLKTDLQAAEQTRLVYQRELASEAPLLPTEPQQPATPQVRSDAENRLEQTRRQLDELLRRYTDEHPDVVASRRLITTLEKQVRAEADMRTRADASRSTGGGAATSPVYQKIRMSLSQTEADIASIRSRLAAEQAQLEEARALAHRVPQVEAELAQLNRDYDVIRRNYEQLVSRRETASLGVKLDESAQLAEFRIVEPARVSPTPLAPSRYHLALGTILFSVLSGIAAAYIASALRPTVSDAKALKALSGRTVVGTVSMFVRPDQHILDRRNMTRFLTVSGVIVVLQVVWVVWVVLSKRM